MKNALLLILPLLLLSLNSFAEKKVVCSMTINSSDEITAFKSHLSPDEFTFVELTSFEKDPTKHWLKNSCDAGVECDVLVISGHFAGTFFGSSGKSLSLMDLEKAACTDECAGIFKKTKEVYLFGCNTLAGKEKDTRTPEAYLQVLLDDGFTLGQAQQVVAFRYSPIGGSFANRMRSVFNKTPQIYGFNSISPLGKHVAPMLNRYLKKNAKNYSSSLSSLFENNSTKTNKELLSLFKSTSMVQASGMSFTLDPDGQLQRSPVCFLSSANKQNTRLEKLKWIETLFSKGNGLELLMYVSEFMYEERARKRWNKEELVVFNAIKDNLTLKTELIGIIDSPAKWLERSKLDVLSFVKEMEWLDKDDVNEKVYSILNLRAKNFNVEDMRKVCSFGVHYPIGIYDFNNSYWSNDYFKYAIMCITPENHYSVWRKITEQNY
jgi:hypothetical protein